MTQKAFKQIGFKLSLEDDKDILNFLSDKPATYAIKRAIREYMANNPQDVPPLPNEVAAPSPAVKEPVIEVTPEPKVEAPKKAAAPTPPPAKDAEDDDPLFKMMGPKE